MEFLTFLPASGVGEIDLQRTYDGSKIILGAFT